MEKKLKTKKNWRFTLNEDKKLKITCKACNGIIEFETSKDKKKFDKKKFVCPKCKESYCIMPETERILFRLQDKWIDTKDMKVLNEIAKICMSYASSIAKKHFSKSFHDLTFLEDKVCDAVFYLTDFMCRHRENGEYGKVRTSFSMALLFKLKQAFSGSQDFYMGFKKLKSLSTLLKALQNNYLKIPLKLIKIKGGSNGVTAIGEDERVSFLSLNEPLGDGSTEFGDYILSRNYNEYQENRTYEYEIMRKIEKYLFDECNKLDKLSRLKGKSKSYINLKRMNALWLFFTGGKEKADNYFDIEKDRIGKKEYLDTIQGYRKELLEAINLGRRLYDEQ